MFMQFAVAGYTCPVSTGVPSNSAEITATASDRSMPGCSGMDQVQPGLCHAYDHAGSQSLDKPELPGVQPFNPAGLVSALSFIDRLDGPLFNHSNSLRLSRAAGQPLSIRNCCLRI
jgi:hypothetical protein